MVIIPKKTFDKLKPEKKDVFQKEAFAEFALKGFWGASLTQLVKSLGIAKGSLYQYFENKEEIYHYLIGEACKRKLAFFSVLDLGSTANHTFSYLVISAKFDLAFPALGALIYQSYSQFDPTTRGIVKAQFIEEIQSPAGHGDFSYKSGLIAHSQTILLLLLDKHRIDLLEIIAHKGAIKLTGNDILETIQSYLKTNSKII